MLSFLFKRFSKRVPPVAENPKQQEKPDAAALAQEKAEALAKAHALAADELAAAEFVLQCKFSDARLQAAQHVHSKHLLERLAQAMRASDRRVAKLAQQRLDAIRQQENVERAAAACIARIESLAEETLILPNQLSEIERAWGALHGIPQEPASRFERGRAALQKRLHEQTALQRALIELRNAAQALSNEIGQLPPSSSGEEMDGRFAVLAEEFSACRASPEAPSLPKNLVSDVEESLASARRMRDQFLQRQAAVAAHEQAYSAWESDPGALQNIDALHRALRSLPALAAPDAELFKQRLEHLQARFAKPASVPNAAPQSAQADMKTYRSVLSALEAALEEGALQTATEREKELRAADDLTLTWNAGERARLANARAELSRLKSWARWGGKVSREELIKAAEELPRTETGPLELAKKIGSLRSQWKSMDAASGVADREAWQRFDAACTTAYAPVAAHFSEQALQRKENLEKAQSLLSELRNFVAAEIAPHEMESADWKRIAAFRSRIRQAWHAVGLVDRREKKALDSQFSEAMNALSGPLAAAQQEEMKRREDLIAQAGQLDASDRNAMAVMRQLQQRWQQQAVAIPLERKDEQAMWKRFRAACDEHVARRKADLQQVDAQHAENFQRKNALCDRLQSQADSPTESIEGLLREAEQEWASIGPVARAQESALRDRYKGIVSGLRSKLAEECKAVRRAQHKLLLKKLGLCAAAEQMLSDAMPAKPSSLEEEWETWDALPAHLEQPVHARFQSALSAMRLGDRAYASMLKQSQAALERDLLRMEILLEIDSPAECAGERLKLQVEALQASLKSGKDRLDPESLLPALCALPAGHDRLSRARIERIVHRLGDGGSKMAD